MSTTPNPFNTLQDIVNQLEYCDYKTKDELHELKDNAAFILLKEVASKVSVPLDGLVTPQIAALIDKFIEVERMQILSVTPNGVTEYYEHRYAMNILNKLKQSLIVNSKEFLDYIKGIPESQAIRIIDEMNLQANQMADRLNQQASQLEPLVMQKPAGSADEIFIKGKIEGLEEARWQINYALSHIDPNGRLEKQTKYLMDEFKKVQDELRAKL